MKKYSIQDMFQELEMIETESPIYEAFEIKSVKHKFPKGSLKIGQKVKYGKKVYNIIDLDWNDKFGYDIEIDKVGSDGKTGVWIGNGNNVELVENLENSQTSINSDNSLKEEKFDLSSKDEVKEAEKVLDEEPEEQVEMVIDVNAENPEELKYSYVGNYILECPTCHTLLYKKPEDLEKDAEDDNYNNEEKCPHCNSREGYLLVGQVAPAPSDANGNEPSEETSLDDLPITVENETEVEKTEVEDTSEEVKETEEDEVVEDETEVTSPPTRESFASVKIKSFDEKVFDKLVTQYLNETYDNVESFKTVNGSVNDKENIIKLEGVINFKSGKTLNTTFLFEARDLTKHGKIKLYGLNESFSKSCRAFILTGKVIVNRLMCESLTYKYRAKDSSTNSSKSVYGRVVRK